MAWQENLFQNLLSVIILVSLGVIIYCRITGKTLKDVITEVREAFATPVYNE